MLQLHDNTFLIANEGNTLSEKIPWNLAADAIRAPKDEICKAQIKTSVNQIMKENDTIYCKIFLVPSRFSNIKGLNNHLS